MGRYDIMLGEVPAKIVGHEQSIREQQQAAERSAKKERRSFER